METLYRKVAVSDDNPTDGKKLYLMEIIGTKNQRLPENEDKRRFWLEEIHDFIPETIEKSIKMIEKLEAEKKELLEALDKATDLLEAGFPEISAVKDFQSLIQKHKQ